MSKTQNLLRAAVTAFCLGATGLGGTAKALAQTHEHGAVREIEIVVEGGYKPNRIEIHEGERVRLKFVRKEYDSCTREVVFTKLGIRRELPPNQPVIIDLPALAPGEYEFKCGMNMIRGTLVVVAHAQH
jgi:plastocyanin domain-containing protein